MKMKLLLLSLAIMATTQVAHADIFGPRSAPKAKGVEAAEAPTFVDPVTILDSASQIIGYLGTREGFFYDFEQEEFVNYLAATIYTEPETGIAFSAGMLNIDGFAVTADYNLGAIIPSQDVPLMNLLQYLYVGGGVGARHMDIGNGNGEEWHLAYGLDAQLKFTF